MKRVRRSLILVFSLIFIFLSYGFVSVSASYIDYEIEYDYSKLNINIPNGYYNNIDLNEDYDSFRLTLNNIISNGYTRYTYDDVSKIIHISDMDPENEKNVMGLYTGLSLSGGWNREHVWSKSHGFSEAEQLIPYTDVHHLRATNAVVNSTRNNSDYGEVDHNTASSDIYGNYWTSTVFEPRDEVKGDCARMIFYVAVRYLVEFDAKIIEGSSLDYYQKKYADSNNASGLQKNGEAVFGYLSTLLKWHYEDPVSEEEIYRNNVVYTFQKNRNPFIDHPEYVEKCWDVSGIDGYNVDTVINESEIVVLEDKIDRLPNTITLDSKSKVEEIHDLYKELNNNEKTSLSKSSYDKLMNAVKTIRSLTKESNNSNNKRTINFSDFRTDGNSRYISEVDANIDGINFYLSNAHYYKACYNYQLSLGYKDKSLIDKEKFPFVSNDYGDYLRIKTPQENVVKIEFLCPALYRNKTYFKGWYIAYGDIENGYTLLNSGNDFNYYLSADLDTPISGEIIFIVSGDTSCISLSTLTITYDNQEDNSIENISNNNTLASIAYNYERNNDANASMVLPNTISSFNTASNNASLLGLDSNIFDLTYFNNNNTNTSNIGTAIRFYKNDILKLSINNGIINELSFVCEDSYNYTRGEYSLDGINYLSISSSSLVVNNDTIYLKATNGQIRFTELNINYDHYSFSNYRIRFGSLIEYNLYEELISKHNVTGYGVFLALENNVSGLTSAVLDCIDRVDNNHSLDSLLSENNINFEARRIAREEDLYIFRTNEEGKEEILDGDYMMFNAFIPLNISNINTKIRSVSYFIVDGEYVLLNEKEPLSFTDVARIYIASGKYSNIINESLSILIK